MGTNVKAFHFAVVGIDRDRPIVYNVVHPSQAASPLCPAMLACSPISSSVAHCPRQRSSSATQPAGIRTAAPHRKQSQLQPRRPAAPRCQAAAAATATVMASTEVKSVSGTMAELKKQKK